MANNKRNSRKAKRRAKKALAASQISQNPVAVAQVDLPARARSSGLVVRDLLGSFAEQTGANFG